MIRINSHNEYDPYTKKLREVHLWFEYIIIETVLIKPVYWKDDLEPTHTVSQGLLSWYVDRDYADIGSVSTHKDCRNNGYATLLLQTMIEFARQSGKSSLYLCTYKDNLAAVHLYEKLGFKWCDHNPTSWVGTPMRLYLA